MKIPLVDLVAQYRTIQPEIDEAIQRVLESGRFILGPNVTGLEKEVAAYLGTKHAIGVASGTDALILTLQALEIGQGDEVIVPAYTFFATVGAVMQVGATPVFVDVEPDTYCLDVTSLGKHISSRTKAIIPVHLYGHPVDMTPLLDLAQAAGIKVIEDNAQAFGSEYNGRKTGSIGDVGCLSFFPSKNLGAYGDGGMVVTNDDEIDERVRMLRAHGWKKKYHPLMVGHNSRIDALQAAILRVKLRHLDEWNEGRRSLAAHYSGRLAGTEIGVPYEAPYGRHVYHLYVIRLKERDKIQERLKQHQIGSAVYYPQAPHLSEACQPLGYKEGDFPISERASHETLAIPLFPEMTTDQMGSVLEVLTS